jgi:transketolase
MCAMADGMSLVKVRPFASTFLIFTDYARGAIRLSALMEIPVIYIWTRESISVSEDGPTHQPIEQLASLRAMPGILVILPLRHEPTVLLLSRQLLPTLDRTRYTPASGLARGGQGPAGPLAPGMSHVPALSARHQKKGRMP